MWGYGEKHRILNGYLVAVDLESKASIRAIRRIL